MVMRLVGQKLRHAPRASVVLGSVMVFLPLLFLGVTSLWSNGASRALAKNGSALFFECVDGCGAGMHCNRMGDGARFCEPDTVLPGSFAVVIPTSHGTKPNTSFSKKDAQGCPISSSTYGKYKKGSDSKCHWVPNNATLGPGNKWKCNTGYNQVPVKEGSAPNGKSKDYECRKT